MSAVCYASISRGGFPDGFPVNIGLVKVRSVLGVFFPLTLAVGAGTENETKKPKPERIGSCPVGISAPVKLTLLDRLPGSF